MLRRHTLTRWLTTTLSLALLAAPATAQGLPRFGGGEPAELKASDLVQVSVRAFPDGVAAGATTHLAVRFDIRKDWHIYWENPGASGMPTELEIDAPKGFIVGQTMFPRPLRFEEPGIVPSKGLHPGASRPSAGSPGAGSPTSSVP